MSPTPVGPKAAASRAASGGDVPIQPTRGPTGLDAATPLLLFPANIETRFVDIAQGGSQLWVRIYPDALAVNSHEPELTAQEILDGTSYWNSLWSAGHPPPQTDGAQAPWRGLVSIYGAPRAAWIALQMTPTNMASQPVAPTPAGATPNPLPVYPTPPTRDSSNEKAPIADALPDAWTVALVSGTTVTRFTSRLVTQGLPMGLTPNSGAFPPESTVDAGMKWLVDFDTALQAGMALKIDLTPAQRQAGFDRLFVYGLRVHDPDGSTTFANLLDAHHFTDGLALVPQGSPTNNTPDASSAYSRKDPDSTTSFSVERQADLSASANCDGEAFTRLMGIDGLKDASGTVRAILSHVRFADGTGVRNGKDMLAALWPATLGYFLKQMMADVFTASQIEDARQYVMANALPRGPVPAFRIGKIPYGVLPVTSLQHYPASTPEPIGRLLASSVEPGLVTFVKRMWPNWLASSASAPHFQKGQDPDPELMGLLGMDASSMTFRGRQVLGNDMLWNYMSFNGGKLPLMNRWISLDLAPGQQALTKFQYGQWDPRVLHLGLADSTYPVTFATVQDGPLSETGPLTADANLGAGKRGNYIDWIRRASVEDLQAENYPGTKPTAILYRILRQSLLLEYADLATEAEINARTLVRSQVSEQEIIGIAAAPAANPPLSPWQILARPSIANPQVTWAQYLVTLEPPPESAFSRLQDLRDSLARLSALPTAELDRLLTETLDACSHRLDVWASAIANSLLSEARSRVPGTHLGHFGWVEEVRPSPARAVVQGTELESVRQLDSLEQARIQTAYKNLGRPAPVLAARLVPQQPLTDNGGYLFAPSAVQAAAGAVLRSGYMSHQGSGEGALLSIDLSSERVRKAIWLIDGIRQGQSLNALLGYLFESGLHSAQLDKYTQPFRDKFPIVGSKLTPASAGSVQVAASNVVDGLALRTAWDAGQLAAGQNWGTALPGPGADQTSVIGILETLDDYADALGDLSISEAVFQVMRGNFGKAGSLMDALSQGTEPADPDVVVTPRRGIDLTHRVAVLIAGNPSASAAWSAGAANPRAVAEPRLTAWLARLLPDPAKVRCTVKYTDSGGDHTSKIALAHLNLSPMDLLSLADAAEVPQLTELEQRILFQAAVPAGAGVQILFDDTGLPAGSILFPDALFLANQLRSLVGAARALGPQDLTVPERQAADGGGQVDMTDLKSRATTAIASLGTAITNLQTAQAGLPGAPGPVQSALMAASYFGILGSVPPTDVTTIADQAASVLTELQKRQTAVQSVNLASAALADLVGVFTTIFGKDFTVLPLFSPPDYSQLQAAFGQSASLVASDPPAPARWMNQLTHIRPAMTRLDQALSLAQILGQGKVAPPAPLLGQLPLVAGDRWLGLPLDPAAPPAKGRLAMACLPLGDPLVQSVYCGLMVDEWPERIPGTQESAAVAFHYEEPKARAPQCLLLATCPDDRKLWDDEIVTAILQETLELAKIRSVDLDSVAAVGQLLPALYFPMNLKGATVSMPLMVIQEALRDV